MSDREIMNAKRAGDTPPLSNTSKLMDYLSSRNADMHKIPDPHLHQLISFIKSGIRIVGYAFIPFSLAWATVLLILSEVIGIIEELV
jgi:hypothetical protein|tara:strand:+ start:62 stop:322 length:261 start_codon:yes stop_codon:yes gene_type:complete